MVGGLPLGGKHSGDDDGAGMWRCIGLIVKNI